MLDRVTAAAAFGDGAGGRANLRALRARLRTLLARALEEQEARQARQGGGGGVAFSLGEAVNVSDGVFRVHCEEAPADWGAARPALPRSWAYFQYPSWT